MRKPSLGERLANNFYGCTDCKVELVENTAVVGGKISGVTICEPCKGKLIEEIDPEDCEHDFDADEGYHCLNCGMDGFEDVMADAYDRAKDFRKYGE